ncbi:glycosyltransferase [Glycomyces luteolus]|uniref:Glycosyltransferase n=1 Tax=Glycomyces luteolus TaxID=2670330 RepID=A0A9X3PH94_9ACTN|nr:glycosyltransferase [Glycomyces luteolus]MDA1362539.1 glycosyltransferase [Glycomyces luteolus]
MYHRVPPELRARFLEDHADIEGKRKPGALSATAIRLGSVGMRDIFTTLAFGEPTTYADAIAAVRSGGVSTPPPPQRQRFIDYLADLASVLAEQRLTKHDLPNAFALYAFLERRFGLSSLDAQHQAVFVHVGARVRNAKWASKQLSRSKRIHQSTSRALACNLARDEWERPEADAKWLARLGRLLRTECVLRTERGTALFDQLETSPQPRSTLTEDVSAILPALEGRSALTGLRSALRQTHALQQILLILDREPDADERALLDGNEQIRLIPVEPGTAFGAAVNVALKETGADFVLVLDPDDWCLPDLVHRHLTTLCGPRGLMVARTGRLRASADLRIGKFGFWRPEVHSRTFLFRRRVVEDLGYFDEIGPESVEEFIDRTRLPYGKSAVSMSRATVLALTLDDRESVPYQESEERITTPWFPAYRSAYWRWHQNVQASGARPYIAAQQEERPFALPASMRDFDGERRFDLVFASDWRPYGGPAKSMMEEIGAALAIGLRVAVMNLEAVRMMTPETRSLCGPVQGLISSGAVEVITPDDAVAIDTLIIRYPLVLQFDRPIEFPGTVRQLFIHANQPPHEADGSDLRYFTLDCERNAARWFGVEPVWVGQGPQAAESLVDTVPPVSRPLSTTHIPGILDAADWLVRRDAFRSDRPVIGRHSRDHYTKWPGDAETLLKVYPGTDGYDVRTMGGSESARQLLDGRLPMNWISYGYDETGVRDFLFQLDFWVYFPNDVRIEAFGRAILEAMAAGCVVVLPEVFRSTFGEGALYAEPDGVLPLIDGLYADFDAFRRQSRRGQEYVREHFSYEWFQGFLRERVLAPRVFEPHAM